MDGVVAVYYEAAAVITVLVLLGQVLELRAREQTGGAIRAPASIAILNVGYKFFTIRLRTTRSTGATARQGGSKKDASERSEASHAIGASRRSGERERV